MTLKEFRLLDLDDQYIILWEKAVPVGEREDRRFKYILYQLDSFYIEISIPVDGEISESMRSFSKQRRLKHYLDAIDINSIKIEGLKLDGSV